jgi:predicted ATPase with chaperone activity
MHQSPQLPVTSLGCQDAIALIWHARLEVLRQPSEDKVVTISQAQGSLIFHATFELAAAMTPCL